jgi:predicted component of type VI protein secretion system
MSEQLTRAPLHFPPGTAVDTLWKQVNHISAGSTHLIAAALGQGTHVRARYGTTMKSLMIGRGKDCDIVIGEATVGRRHAELISDSATRFVLIDRNSTNGTFVWHKGKWMPVTSSTLVGLDDRVRLGGYETSIGQLVGAAQSKRAKPPSGDVRSRVIERNPKTGEIIERRKR